VILLLSTMALCLLRVVSRRSLWIPVDGDDRLGASGDSRRNPDVRHVITEWPLHTVSGRSTGASQGQDSTQTGTSETTGVVYIMADWCSYSFSSIGGNDE